SSIETTPAATRLPNVEGDFVITLSPRQSSRADRQINPDAPTNPRSLSTTRNTKSVGASGRHPSDVWVAPSCWPGTDASLLVPPRPPCDTAISDGRSWKPPDLTSFGLGCRNDVRRETWYSWTTWTPIPGRTEKISAPITQTARIIQTKCCHGRP